MKKNKPGSGAVRLATSILAALLLVEPSIAATNPLQSGTLRLAATAQPYRFELAAPPKAVSGGKNIVTIHIVRTADRKPITGAIIIQSRADMGPDGMANMTAPIRSLPVTSPGVYAFEIGNSSVWTTPAKWALTFAAKIQGETATVRGTVVVELKPQSP